MGRGLRRRTRTPVAPGLGARIRQRRRELGLTQTQLAGQTLSRAYVGQVERGIARPSFDALTHIAERLGTTALDLGVASTPSAPTALSATTDALALYRAALATATPEERDLIKHAEWILSAVLANLSRLTSPEAR